MSLLCQCESNLFFNKIFQSHELTENCGRVLLLFIQGLLILEIKHVLLWLDNFINFTEEPHLLLLVFWGTQIDH